VQRNEAMEQRWGNIGGVKLSLKKFFHGGTEENQKKC